MQRSVWTMALSLALGVISSTSQCSAGLFFYSDPARFMAALTNPGVDTFDDLSLGVTASPVYRSAGTHSYMAFTNGWDTPMFRVVELGSPGDGSLSVDPTSPYEPRIMFRDFSSGVNAFGLYLYGIDAGGQLETSATGTLTFHVACVRWDDGTMIDPTMSPFIGVISNEQLTSVYIDTNFGVSNMRWPAVNNLILGTIVVPEPSAAIPLSILLVGFQLARRSAPRG